MALQRDATHRPRRFHAYLADPLAVGGAGPLMRQKRAVERLAAMLGGHVGRWGVDSGRRFAGQRCGDAMLALLADLERGDTVLVEGIGVLGFDREAAEVVAGTMAMLGIAVASARDFGVAGEVADPWPASARPARTSNARRSPVRSVRVPVLEAVG